MSIFIYLVALAGIVVMSYSVYHFGKKLGIARGQRLIEDAKARAYARNRNRQFDDTNPSHEWTEGMELDLSLNGKELDDSVDGRGKLTDEQKEIINLIMEGHAPRAVHNPKPINGLSAQHISGYTASNSVFSSDNQVEKIDPNK